MATPRPLYPYPTTQSLYKSPFDLCDLGQPVPPVLEQSMSSVIPGKEMLTDQRKAGIAVRQVQLTPAGRYLQANAKHDTNVVASWLSAFSQRTLLD